MSNPVHELAAIDEAALLMLHRLVADIEAGRVVVVDLAAADSAERLGLAIGWAERPVPAAAAAADGDDDSIVLKAGDSCPSCEVGRIVDLTDSFGCGRCGWPSPAES